MELKDGFYDGVICEGKIIKSRFNQEGSLELWFKCGYYDEAKQPAGKCDIYLELSNRYGMGNDSSKMEWQITKEKLEKLGWQGEFDLTKLSQLNNKPCRLSYVTKDKNGVALKYGPRWSFSFRKENQEVDAATANAMLAQMMGGATAAATPAFGNGTAAMPPNPFA